MKIRFNKTRRKIVVFGIIQEKKIFRFNKTSKNNSHNKKAQTKTNENNKKYQKTRKNNFKIKLQMMISKDKI